MPSWGQFKSSGYLHLILSTWSQTAAKCICSITQQKYSRIFVQLWARLPWINIRQSHTCEYSKTTMYRTLVLSRKRLTNCHHIFCSKGSICWSSQEEEWKLEAVVLPYLVAQTTQSNTTTKLYWDSLPTILWGPPEDLTPFLHTSAAYSQGNTLKSKRKYTQINTSVTHTIKVQWKLDMIKNTGWTISDW